ncbi:hypothetical protein ACSNOG_05170 [Streptomyces sp. URMC 124]
MKETRRLASRTAFKHTCISEAVSVLTFTLLCFAASVVFVTEAAYSGVNTPVDQVIHVHISWPYSTVVGTLAGCYFWVRLTQPIRYNRRSVVAKRDDKSIQQCAYTSVALAVVVGFQPSGWAVIPWVAFTMGLYGASVKHSHFVSDVLVRRVYLSLFTAVIASGIACGAVECYAGQLGAVAFAAISLTVSSLVAPILASKRDRKKYRQRNWIE